MKLLHLSTAMDILLWVIAVLATVQAVHTSSNSSQPGMRREISMHSRVYFSLCYCNPIVYLYACSTFSVAKPMRDIKYPKSFEL